jgi:DNA-binding response OmpR family regulator
MRIVSSQPPVRVVVVEDDWLIREMLADVLEEAGFTTSLAFSAKEALRLLEQDADFDLVVTDVELPGVLDGIDLARLVAARWPQLGTLMISGCALRTIPAGARFLAKPFTPAELINMLRGMRAPAPIQAAS